MILNFIFIGFISSVTAECPPSSVGCEPCIKEGCWYWEGNNLSICGFPPFPQGGVVIVSPTGQCPSTTTTTSTTPPPTTTRPPTPAPERHSSIGLIVGGILSAVFIISIAACIAVIKFYGWSIATFRHRQEDPILDDNHLGEGREERNGENGEGGGEEGNREGGGGGEEGNREGGGGGEEENEEGEEEGNGGGEEEGNGEGAAEINGEGNDDLNGEPGWMDGNGEDQDQQVPPAGQYPPVLRTPPLAPMSRRSRLMPQNLDGPHSNDEDN